MRTIHGIRVAGVTYENRQVHLAKIAECEPVTSVAVRLVPEPTNAYDPNAIAVHVACKGEVLHCGYVPRELAKDIAPIMEGEHFDAAIEAVTGGFELSDGSTAAYGLRLRVELPDAEVGSVLL